jgi:hypothetical protein
MLFRSSRGPVAAFCVAFAFLSPLAAQCGANWQPGAPCPGLAGSAYAAVVLPSGDLVVGGNFRLADATRAERIARWDGTTWQALGAGLDNTVRALAVQPNGDLIAGGDFTQAGGNPANAIARWNGATWSPLGAGCGGRVAAVLALPNGDVIAGGQFSTAGGAPAARIARWDGSNWSPLGSGINFGEVYCLAAASNGDVLVGGNIANAGGITSPGVARWNGTAWQAVPGLSSPSYVFDIQPLAGGSFAVAGLLAVGSATAQVAISNGATMQVLTPPPGVYNELGVDANGQLLAGGYVPGSASGTVARWNGASWTAIGVGAPFRTFALELAANGDVIAAGDRIVLGATVGNAVARFDGNTWTSLGQPQPPRISSVAALPDGSVLVAGQFAAIAGVPANNIARWNGLAWSPLGLGVDGPVTALTVTDGGTVLVGGEFANAGGGPAARVARWNGTTWSSVGAGLAAAPTDLAANDQGEVLARVSAQLQRFDGLGWQVQVLPFAGNVLGITAAPGGEFVIGGVFSTPTGVFGSARLVGGAATLIGSPGLMLMLVFGRDADGSVLTAGTGLDPIRRLVGNTWTVVGSGAIAPGGVARLFLMPNGDIAAVSRPLPDGTALLSRFDGSAWTQLATIGRGGGNQQDIAATTTRDGDIVVVGNVVEVAGLVSCGLAMATPACPAAAVPVGTGCTGSGGPMALLADNLPWTGGTLRATATGFPALALALQVIGVTPTVQPLPLGAAGCSLFTSPDLIAVLFPSGGAVAAPLAVPREPSLVGVVARMQVVGLELDAALALVRVTSTNALQLTIGAL